MSRGCALIVSLRLWIIWDNKIYDLTDYFNTQNPFSNNPNYQFISADVEDVFKQRSGQDVSKDMNEIFAAMNSTYRGAHLNCLDTVFYFGDTDFRTTAKCQVHNYMLLVFSGIMMASMGLKCTFLPRSSVALTDVLP